MLIRSPKELALLVISKRKKLKLSQTKVANKARFLIRLASLLSVPRISERRNPIE